jgi:hypothetical protein
MQLDFCSVAISHTFRGTRHVDEAQKKGYNAPQPRTSTGRATGLKSTANQSTLIPDMSEYSNKVIIKGLTLEGNRFRPSDWAQRLTNAVATVGPNNRIIYHPNVTLAVIEGISAVLIDQSMAHSDPRLYLFLMKFADSNNLQVENLPE